MICLRFTPGWAGCALVRKCQERAQKRHTSHHHSALKKLTGQTHWAHFQILIIIIFFQVLEENQDDEIL